MKHFLTGCLTFFLIFLNTVLHGTVLLGITPLKFIPLRPWQRLISRILIAIAESWITVNSTVLDALHRTHWQIEGPDSIHSGGWYLVICNHQSWVDILALQYAFNRRIPFLKFFLKQELIWVPILGAAWWALDFPFMKRYSREELERKPHLKGKDIETTRKACEKFKTTPVSVMNFVEGSRFTPEKHTRQHSPFRNLLKPKAGGMAFVLAAMGESLQAIIDVTIIYPEGRPTFWDLMQGKVKSIQLHYRLREIPAEFLGGDYEQDPEFRARFQQWVNGLWEEKDRFISQQLDAATRDHAKDTVT